KKSIEYLLREKNPEQQKDIKILSTTTKQDLINFENYILDKNKSNPYVCGVLSFEEKSISEELKTKLITEFEDILFAGIEQENRPPVMWVEHNDKGRVELNYLTFNSLQDRRSYTVYLDKRDRGLVMKGVKKLTELKRTFAEKLKIKNQGSYNRRRYKPY
ncbi:hypothetical protein ACEXB4_005250, partial [Klebsiella pneumoniae]